VNGSLDIATAVPTASLFANDTTEIFFFSFFSRYSAQTKDSATAIRSHLLAARAFLHCTACPSGDIVDRRSSLNSAEAARHKLPLTLLLAIGRLESWFGICFVVTAAKSHIQPLVVFARDWRTTDVGHLESQRALFAGHHLLLLEAALIS
jgi:hypothetical protein